MTNSILVAGVSGAGKTTVGQALAHALGWDFLDADDLHPEANVRKMRSGVPLTDDDRKPWLASLREQLVQRAAAGGNTVVAFSGLKRAYRERVRFAASVRHVYLTGNPALFRARLEHRQGHFAPASLLESQLDTEERPGDDEDAVILDAALAPDVLTVEIIRRLSL